ncbi:hypothetical protein FQR65_LT10080 [Abscondita terminalis]|nr:hypothetical protein FQR65_LT10080 [Abscondita terminalis]
MLSRKKTSTQYFSSVEVAFAVNTHQNGFSGIYVLYLRYPERRYLRDAENPMEFYNSVKFQRRFGFRKETVNTLISLLFEDENHANNRGLPIPPIIQLLVALRFYAFIIIIIILFGLDSALFADATIDRRIESSDDNNVQMVHTNGNFFGYLDQRGFQWIRTNRYVMQLHKKTIDLSNFLQLYVCIPCNGCMVELVRTDKGFHVNIVQEDATNHTYLQTKDDN